MEQIKARQAEVRDMIAQRLSQQQDVSMNVGASRREGYAADQIDELPEEDQ